MKVYKKWVVLVSLLMVVTFTTGAKDNGCGSEDDKLAVTQLALASVQIGAQWMNTTVQEKCTPEPRDGWTQEDCDTWNENWPLVTEVVENILPWAIDKLWQTTTPEEREALIENLEDGFSYSRKLSSE